MVKYIGVLLCQFNECQNVKISTLILEAKENHLKEFQENFDKLPEEVKEYFRENFGQHLNAKVMKFCDIIQVMFVEIKDKK